MLTLFFFFDGTYVVVSVMTLTNLFVDVCPAKYVKTYNMALTNLFVDVCPANSVRTYIISGYVNIVIQVRNTHCIIIFSFSLTSSLMSKINFSYPIVIRAKRTQNKLFNLLIKAAQIVSFISFCALCCSHVCIDIQ
jgi:hypothetical protein